MTIKGLDAWLTTPPDEPDYPCIVCGKEEDACKCPECSECGAVGCIEHMTNHELQPLYEVTSYRMDELEKEVKKRMKKTAPCPKCGKESDIHPFQDYPSFCCDYEYWSDKWIKDAECVEAIYGVQQEEA